mmetsp:Transcript_28800/g.73936  ORF Transcript_28800/g.73936 Transcript_28800/m.73936 type:complete len:247 (+) Transcript_28800:2178-2918(+)
MLQKLFEPSHQIRVASQDVGDHVLQLRHAHDLLPKEVQQLEEVLVRVAIAQPSANQLQVLLRRVKVRRRHRLCHHGSHLALGDLLALDLGRSRLAFDLGILLLDLGDLGLSHSHGVGANLLLARDLQRLVLALLACLGLATFLGLVGHDRLGLRQEVGELLQQVGVAAEEQRHLVVHLRDGLLRLAVHVQDLKEGAVYALVAGKALLDLVHVADGLVELHRLLLCLFLLQVLHRDLVPLWQKCVEP